MTTQDVLDAMDHSDEEDYDVDEPCKYGSDEEFSDLSGEEDNDEDDMDTSTPHSPSPATSASPDSSQPPPTWTSNLKPVTITPFQSAVGPTMPFSDSPLDIFQLFCTTPLLQTIYTQEKVMRSQYCKINNIGF